MTHKTQRGRRWSQRTLRGIALGAALSLFPLGCAPDKPAAQRTDPPLSTGRWLEGGFAQASQDVGSLPINLALSPDGKFAVTTGAGYRESLWSVSTADGRGVGEVPFHADKLLDPANGLYYGLAFAPDGTLYAAQGNAARITVLKIGADGKLTPDREIRTGKASFPAGLALDGRGVLYVTDNDPPSPHAANPPGPPGTNPTTRPGEPLSTDRAAYFGDPSGVEAYDAKTGERLGRFNFESAHGMSVFPLAITALPDGHKVYVASQRDGALYVLDAKDPAAMKQSAVLSTGSHPDALLLNKSASRLFVANAHSDTVSVVDTATDKVVGTVLLRPEIAKDLAGATPTGLALSPDEKTLYASLGDMNAVAVVSLADRDHPKLLGYVPAGWYPTAVAATLDGKRLLVANAKGDKVRVPHNANARGGLGSPLELFEGTVSTVAVPSEKELADLTQKVLENCRLTPAFLHQENPLKDIAITSNKPQKIRHVIYIVKENRTYDQVLGDMPQGNGDPKRCIFGREITPNLHALAERFVLMDNFYDSGEVSGDGWTWSTQAHANEYTEKTVPYHYSGRGRAYDWEGRTNDYPTGGFPAIGPDGKPLSNDPRFKDGGKAIPDVAEAPGGHIWDLVQKAGLSYRNYGFFVDSGLNNKNGPVIPDNWPAAASLQPPGHDLQGVTDYDFRQFDLDYADSEAPRIYAEKNKDDHYLRRRRTFGKYNAPSRFTEWNREFQLMLKKDPTGGAVPAFETIRICDDHTAGGSANKPTPRSMVADNDYGVAQLVEAVSKSPIWESTAIFIVEDDAQNGPDHVDAHRSTCYVISPWIKKGSVDHTFQNTVSLIKTMELVLGLPPMCQYDAASGAILDWDDAPRNNAPYEAILPDEKWIGQINPGLPKPKPAAKPAGKAAAGGATEREERAWAELAEESAAMDFAHADRAPADALNRIIWKTVHGVDSEMPPTPLRPGPVVAGPGGVKVPVKRKDDDDD